MNNNMTTTVVVTVIKDKDSNSQEQTSVIDFLVDVGSAQPLIYTKFLESKVRRTKLKKENVVKAIDTLYSKNKDFLPPYPRYGLFQM
jgi:hypothetical protein